MDGQAKISHVDYARACISNIGQICYDAGQRTGDCSRVQQNTGELITALRTSSPERWTRALEYVISITESYDRDFAEQYRKKLRHILLPPDPNVQ